MKTNSKCDVTMASSYLYADSQQYTVLNVTENEDNTLNFHVKKVEESSREKEIEYDFDPIDKSLTFECYHYNYDYL